MDWKKEADRLKIPREVQRRFALISDREKEELLEQWRKKRADEERAARESELSYLDDETDFGDDDDDWDSEPEDPEITENGKTEAEQEEEPDLMTEEETDSEYSGEDQTDGKTIAMESLQDYRQRKYDFSSMQQKPVRDGINTVNIMTIFDGTSSFATVFPGIYSVYEEFIRRITELKKELPDVVVKYGLLVFGAEGEGFRRAEFGGSYFTDDEAKLFESIRNIRFQGGAPDGKEDVNGAIKEGIRILETGSEQFANLGLVLFTDSLPEDIFPKFDTIRVEGKLNRGLRFANIYSYNDRYIPTFNIVDKDGNRVEGGKNEGGQITGIGELLKPGGSEIMKQTVSEVMRQASVIK